MRNLYLWCVVLFVAVMLGCRSVQTPAPAPARAPARELILPLPTAAFSPPLPRPLLPGNPPATHATFSCETEYSAIVGYRGFFEACTDLAENNWVQVATFPYDGQTHHWTNWFTNAPVCWVRAGSGFSP